MTQAAGRRDRHPGLARAGLVALASCVVLAATSMALPVLLPDPPTRGHRALLHYFDVAANTTLPAWWATALLLTAALAQGMAGVTSRIGRMRGAWCWFTGAAVLAVLSLDEHTQLYERLETLEGALVAVTGFPHPVLATGAAVGLTVATALALLAIREPGRTRWLLVAGTTLLLGSVTAHVVALQLNGSGAGHLLVTHSGWLSRTIGALLLAAAGLSAVTVTRDGTGVRLRRRTAPRQRLTAPRASLPAPVPALLGEQREDKVGA